MQLGHLRVSGMRMTDADFVARLKAIGFVLAAPQTYVRDYADGGYHHIRLVDPDHAEVILVPWSGRYAKNPVPQTFAAILSDFQPLVTL